MNSKAFDSIPGNESAKEYVTLCINNGCFPQALIIEGPEGTGKKSFARLISASFVCSDELRPCLSCDRCKRILEDASQDVLWVRPEKDRKTIGVDGIRDLRDSIYTVPAESDKKIIIIHDASVMTEQAQNALLKTIEEPPSFVHFLLLATNASKLLPTVRSRAPSVRMQIFEEAELSEFLPTIDKKAADLKKSDPETYAFAIRASSGCYEKAIKAVGSSRSEKATNLIDTARSIVCTLGSGSRAQLVSCFYRQKFTREEICEITKMVCYALRDIYAAKKGCTNTPMLFFLNYDEAKDHAAPFAADKVIKMYEAARESYIDLCRISLNAKLAAVHLADAVCNARDGIL